MNEERPAKDRTKSDRAPPPPGKPRVADHPEKELWSTGRRIAIAGQIPVLDLFENRRAEDKPFRLLDLLRRSEEGLKAVKKAQEAVR